MDARSQVDWMLRASQNGARAASVQVAQSVDTLESFAVTLSLESQIDISRP